ncbi:Ankyrin repeat protein [Planctomycetes bacterium Pan216]|uniref:Ankyrin repeat protein n=1 Tax=Kolteria novifilia TaxID=2527975 RepID=A0A518B8L0_9BACT|nr:Ankyrin repeat protein [Planctomycetes bacterium Pan216]
MADKIPQKCPECGGSFTAKKLTTTCPHCGTKTELGIDGNARYAYVAPKPNQGKTFTATDLLNEFSAKHVSGPGMPDLMGVNKILKTVSINDVCPESGMTPLHWAIVNRNRAVFSLCLARGADASKRGTGEYEIAPIELAHREGLTDFVDRLVSHGASADDDMLRPIKEQRQVAAAATRERAAVVKETIARLTKEGKRAWYQEQVKHFEEILGIKSSVARGRGIRAFEKVPVKSLAEKNLGMEEWLIKLHDLAFEGGATLFCEKGLTVSSKIRLLLAPTKSVLDVVAVSNLLSPDEPGCERVDIGRQLEKLYVELPYRILECGRDGVLGDIRAMPDDLEGLAKRLLDICPHYGQTLQAGNGKPWEKVDDVTAVKNDLTESRGFFLTWD